MHCSRQVVERVRLDRMVQEDMLKTMPKLLSSPKPDRGDDAVSG